MKGDTVSWKTIAASHTIGRPSTVLGSVGQREELEQMKNCM